MEFGQFGKGTTPVRELTITIVANYLPIWDDPPRKGKRGYTIRYL